MKKRIKIGNAIILIASLVIILLASSCTAPKVYTQRNSGINGKSGGAATVAKTQKHYNFESAMKRNQPKKFIFFK